MFYFVCFVGNCLEGPQQNYFGKKFRKLKDSGLHCPLKPPNRQQSTEVVTQILLVTVHNISANYLLNLSCKIKHNVVKH